MFINKIVILIAMLGSPNYTIRNQAQKGLEQCGYEAYIFAKTNKYKDPEIRRRLEQVKNLFLEIKGVKEDLQYNPWLQGNDKWMKKYHEYYTLAEKSYSTITDMDYYIYPEELVLIEASRMLFKDMLDKGISRKVIKKHFFP